MLQVGTARGRPSHLQFTRKYLLPLLHTMPLAGASSFGACPMSSLIQVHHIDHTRTVSAGVLRTTFHFFEHFFKPPKDFVLKPKPYNKKQLCQYPPYLQIPHTAGVTPNDRGRALQTPHQAPSHCSRQSNDTPSHPHACGEVAVIFWHTHATPRLSSCHYCPPDSTEGGTRATAGNRRSGGRMCLLICPLDLFLLLLCDGCKRNGQADILTTSTDAAHFVCFSCHELPTTTAS